MANDAVDPERDQRLGGRDLDRGRPILAQIDVGAIQHIQAARKPDRAEPAQQLGASVVGELRPAAEDVNQRDDLHAGKSRQVERQIDRAGAIIGGLLLPSSLFDAHAMRKTNHFRRDQTDQKDQLEEVAAARAFASTSRLIVNSILRDITQPIGSVNTSQINLNAKVRGA